MIRFLILILPIVAFAKEVPDSAVRTNDIIDICTTKTSEVRDVSQKKKKQVYSITGIPFGDKQYCRYGYEVDHIIPLCMGGSNDISNLQLQTYCKKTEFTGKVPILFDAKEKDKMEKSLCSKVCSGKISLETARDRMYNWKN